MRFLDDKSLERLRSAGAMPDLSGTRYQLVDFLARGGMGAVYLAEDQTLHRRVALKILEIEDERGELAARLVREAQILAKLEHPGIVPVHDAGILADGRVFYAMKFVQGARLDKFLSTVSSVSERLRLFLRICDAVSFAHSRGVIHRDLKPANIMIGAFGEVLVMDWGLAKILATNSGSLREATEEATLFTAVTEMPSQNESRKTATGNGVVMGTPGYMSPEQERGDSGSIDARSDIFSLGRLLSVIVNEPDGGKPVKAPKSLRAVYEKATATNPDHRYRTVREMAEDLARFLDGEQVSAYRENVWERAGRFYNRYQAAILLITAYLFMRALFILYPRR